MNNYTLHHGDCLDILRTLPDASVDAIVTDPPAGIAFMGKDWDRDKGGRAAWVAWMAEVATECLRVIKPGGHALVWAIPRTAHWTACAWEDAGWELRDKVYHAFGSGFPKSLDVSKAIDKGHGENLARQFQFTAWMRSTGITARQIDDITGTKMGSHYTTHPTQPAIATADMFDKLRPYLPEVPEEIERLVCERTGLEWTAYKQRPVIGQHPENSTPAGFGDHRFTFINRNITAPATDAAKQWHGWSTALKPAIEEWLLLRKPLSERTVAANVLRWGTGAINVDGCRVGAEEWSRSSSGDVSSGKTGIYGTRQRIEQSGVGRYPAHLVHDGSDEVVGLFPSEAGGGFGVRGSGRSIYEGGLDNETGQTVGYGDTGSAARFFAALPPDAEDHDATRLYYCAKASKADRDEGLEAVTLQTVNDGRNTPIDNPYQRGETERRNVHPTVKPVALMRWLCRLITPRGGTILDPFTGSGSTGKAAMLEGFGFIGIEREAEYIEIARARIEHAASQPKQRSLFDK